MVISWDVIGIYPLVKLQKLWKITIEIVSFPMQN